MNNSNNKPTNSTQFSARASGPERRTGKVILRWKQLKFWRIWFRCMTRAMSTRGFLISMVIINRAYLWKILLRTGISLLRQVDKEHLAWMTLRMVEVKAPPKHLLSSILQPILIKRGTPPLHNPLETWGLLTLQPIKDPLLLKVQIETFQSWTEENILEESPTSTLLAWTTEPRSLSPSLHSWIIQVARTSKQQVEAPLPSWFLLIIIFQRFLMGALRILS